MGLKDLTCFKPWEHAVFTKRHFGEVIGNNLFLSVTLLYLRLFCWVKCNPLVIMISHTILYLQLFLNKWVLVNFTYSSTIYPFVSFFITCSPKSTTDPVDFYQNSNGILHVPDSVTPLWELAFLLHGSL